MSVPFHADLSIPSSQAAGATLLFDPKPNAPGDAPGVCVRKLSISTDTAMRIVIGTADQNGFRIRAGWFGANGGMTPEVLWTDFSQAKIYIFTSLSGNLEIAIEGVYIAPS